MCRSCAEIDGAGSCEIDNTPYEIGFNPTVGRIDCSANPPCAERLCSCDEALGFALAGLWEEFDDANKMAEGFDHAASCQPKVTTGGGGGTCGEYENTEEVATKCCGAYPSRFPYNNKGGCISCCATKTYNVYKMSCCDNTVQSFGTC